jgi:protein-S-isoprenylcysteine O-methyltransferase Ste14
MSAPQLQVDAAFVVAAVTMPVASAVIASVYLLQYRAPASWRWMFVSAHFVAVSAIVCTYIFLTIDRYGSSAWQVPGAVLFVVGSAVFWYSVHCHPTCLVPDAAGGVVSRGPYNYIRHPIYSGGLLGAFGLIGLARSWDLVVVWLVLLASLIALALVEERELRARFMTAYADYSRRTRLLIPGVL